MKKLVVSFLTAILFSGAASAADYRGVVELGVGSAVHKEIKYDHSLTSVAVEFSTTHGAQLNRHIFVGAGVDLSGYLSVDIYDMGADLKVFGDFRYDLDITKRWSPFVNLKVGCRAVPAKVDGEIVLEDGTLTRNWREEKYVPFYINPSVGVRLRLSSKCGLNFSVGYTPLKIRKTSGLEGTYYDYSVSQDVPYKNGRLGLKNGQAFTFNVGIDF